MLMPDKFFWVAVLLAILLFVFGVTIGHTQDTRLSDVGILHRISMKGCGDGSYAVESEEMGCTLIWKSMGLADAGTIYIKSIDYDKDGDCNCPEGD